MQHQRGDVPGPTTQGGERAEDSARPGERAAESQPSPPPPLGYGEGSSTTPAGEQPDPVPEKYHNPSEGESPTRTPSRGGGYLIIPGEDS